MDAVVFSEVELHQYIITDEEWERINLLVEVLRPFKDATVFMSSSEYPTLSMVVPLYHTLFDTLEETIRQNNTIEWLVQGCEAAKSKLTDYCHKTNILYLAAIVLDPRLKLDYFKGLEWSSQKITQIKNIVANKYESQYAPVATNQRSHSTELPTKSIMSRIYNKRTRLDQRSELDSYLTAPPVEDQHANILE